MTKNFTIIFVVNMILRTIMQGLLPLYPIITERVGATKQENGYILAFSYSMLLISTLASGFLIPKFITAKKLLLVSVLPMCSGIFFIGFANTIMSFVFASMLLFFFAGLNIISGIILISQFSSVQSVGRNFGVIGLSNLLGSLLGGFTVGPLLFGVGYKTGFIIFALILFVTCLFVFFIVEPKAVGIVENKKPNILTRNFLFVLISFTLAVMLIHVFLFSFSLSMKAAGFNISQISIYSALGTALSLPFPYLFGQLTKKFNAKKLSIVVYGCIATALLLLLLPKLTVTILLAVALMSVLSFAGRVPIVALVFPWFDNKQQPMAQSYIATAAWLAAIIGYLTSGIILQNFGFTLTIVYGLIISIVAILIMGFFVTTQKHD